MGCGSVVGTLDLGTKVATHSCVGFPLHNSRRGPSEGKAETQRHLVWRLTFCRDGAGRGGNIRRAECSEEIPTQQQ